MMSPLNQFPVEAGATAAWLAVVLLIETDYVAYGRTPRSPCSLADRNSMVMVEHSPFDLGRDPVWVRPLWLIEAKLPNSCRLRLRSRATGNRPAATGAMDCACLGMNQLDGAPYALRSRFRPGRRARGAGGRSAHAAGCRQTLGTAILSAVVDEAGRLVRGAGVVSSSRSTRYEVIYNRNVWDSTPTSQAPATAWDLPALSNTKAVKRRVRIHVWRRWRLC